MHEKRGAAAALDQHADCGAARPDVGWYRHITLAMLAHASLAAAARESWEKGAQPVGRPGSSSSQWRRFGDSWQLVVSDVRT